MSIEGYIINNFKNDNKEGIREAIEESVKSNDEVTLPGMGVFMKIIWSTASQKLKDEMLSIIESNLK